MSTPFPLGSQFLINTTTSADQTGPVIAAMADGRFVVTWNDLSQTGGDTDLYAVRAQIFDADGSKLGAEFLVNTTTTSAQITTAIAVLEGGSFVVAFVDVSANEDGSFAGIRAQMFDRDGVPVGPEFLVNTTTPGTQLNPVITPLADGGFVIGWDDSSLAAPDTSISAIRAQIFDASGDASGGEFVVNTTTAGPQGDPEVGRLADGGFVFVWRDQSGTGDDTSGSAIRAQVYAADGTPAGGEFLVNTSTNGDQDAPVVAGLADGSFVVAWTDFSLSGGDTDDGAVRAQLYAADGTPIGGEILVNTTTAGLQDHPSVTALEDGRFVIVWQSGPPGDRGVYAQLFNSDGSKSGEEFRVDESISDDVDGVHVAAFADGRLIFTWDESLAVGDDTDGQSIQGRIIDPRSEAVTLFGTLGADHFIGTGFDDTIAGRGGIDRLAGEAGADALFGDGGDDDLSGGLGSDTVEGGDGDDAVAGDAGHDTLRGNAGDDDVDGGSGNDLVEGGDGADELLGGTGSDALRGGAGNDLLDGGVGDDEASGGAGDDTYRLDSAGDTIVEAAGEGTDTIELVLFSVSLAPYANVENATLAGTGDLDLTGNDLANVLTGNGGDNTLSGLGGNDSLSGGGGDDNVSGGAGNDVLNGGGGTNVLGGGGGNDRYLLNAGDTVVEASGEGIDTVVSNVPIDLANYANVENAEAAGGAGISLSGNNGANVLTGNDGGNTISGRDGNDQLYGKGGADHLGGGDGDDLLDGGVGGDTADGGSGADVYVVDSLGDVVSDSAGVDEMRSATIDLVLPASIENALLTGHAALDITGNDLANVVTGNAGDNVLRGLQGNDTLTGGTGADSFVFDTALNRKANLDTITDFTTDDTIVLDQAVFAKLKLGALKVKSYHEGKKAHDGNDRIIYNPKNGNLIYDENGHKKGGAIKFAALDKGLDLSEADFLVI